MSTMQENEKHKEWLKQVFENFSEHHWSVADVDEVKYFVDWVTDPRRCAKDE